MKATELIRSIFDVCGVLCPFVYFSVLFKEHCQCPIKATSEIITMAMQIDSLCGKKLPIS
jgi:hypothetical protein